MPFTLVAGLVFGVYQLEGVTPASAVCSIGECPLELHESDAGQTFTYDVNTRFTVYLDSTDNPPQDLTCTPDGIIGVVTDVPSVAPPMYAARFEAIAPGTCKLSDDHYHARITVD